jgi:hypothetical protein
MRRRVAAGVAYRHTSFNVSRPSTEENHIPAKKTTHRSQVLCGYKRVA